MAGVAGGSAYESGEHGEPGWTRRRGLGGTVCGGRGTAGAPRGEAGMVGAGAVQSASSY